MDLNEFMLAMKIKRIEAGKTIDQVENLTGVSHSTISKMENGANTRIGTIITILDSLGYELKIEKKVVK